MQTIAFIQLILSKDHGLKILLVSPSTIISQWVRMLRQWSPQTRAVILNSDAASLHSSYGSSEEKIHHFLGDMQITNDTIYICSYDFCSAYHSAMKAKFNNCVMVIDEVHLLKNEKSLRSKGACNIPAAFRLGLTGTPIQNTYLELFNLVNFVCPGFLGDRKQFTEEYAKTIQKGQYKYASTEDIRQGIFKAYELQK